MISAVVGRPRGSLVVHATCIFRSAFVIDGTSAVIFMKRLFDFPISLFGANAELKILFGDGIPVLFIVSGIYDRPEPWKEQTL